MKGPVAAFFDVDGTVVNANIVHYYVHFSTRGFPRWRRAAWIAAFLPKVLYYLLLDGLSRGRFNEVFYRNYRGMDAERVRALARENFESVIRPRILAGALARIAEHRAAREPVVLVTGSLDFVVAPLADFLQADAILAVALEEESGRFTGELTSAPISEEEKARVVRAFAAERGIDLAGSTAYGDSTADLPLLRAVGHPRAVNPDRTLARVARREGWTIEFWPAPGKGRRR